MCAESRDRPAAHVAQGFSPAECGQGPAQVRLTLHGAESRSLTVAVRDLVIAGWTGRDAAALEAHIKELEELGVPRPDRTPMFYPMPASLLTTAPEVEVTGRDSTGEVEFVLIEHAGELWVGLGSDHTDRQLETVSIARSKEVCPKPIAPEAWRFEEVEPHWNHLILRAYATSAGATTLYQEGSVTAIRHPRELMALYSEHHGRSFGPAIAMFCGTFAVKGGLRWADTFGIELEDPVLGRRIAHRYQPRDVTAPAARRASNEGA